MASWWAFPVLTPLLVCCRVAAAGLACAVRSRAPAAGSALALRAARCPCTGACQSSRVLQEVGHAPAPACPACASQHASDHMSMQYAAGLAETRWGQFSRPAAEHQPGTNSSTTQSTIVVASPCTRKVSFSSSAARPCTPHDQVCVHAKSLWRVLQLAFDQLTIIGGRPRPQTRPCLLQAWAPACPSM